MIIQIVTGSEGISGKWVPEVVDIVPEAEAEGTMSTTKGTYFQLMPEGSQSHYLF